jgi:hypothetical protein
MNWLPSILTGLLAAPICAIITGTAADSWARWINVSSRDGAAGYWVVLMALIAALVGLILGISISRGWLLTTPNFWSAMGATLGIVTGVTLVITGLLWLVADLEPKIDGRPIEIHAELRYPAGASLEAVKASSATATIARVAAGDQSSSANFEFKAAQDVDGQITVPVSIPLVTSTREKRVEVAIAGGATLIFPLNFGSKPKQKDMEWSGWLAPTQGPAAYAFRYRAYVVPPPPPPQTREQQDASEEEKRVTEMRALAPDAPLAQWLVHTKYGASQPRIEEAVAAIRARPNYIADMAHEMLEGEYEASRNALRAMEHLKPPSAELAGAVATVGDQIAQALLDLEKVPPEAAEYNELTTAVDTRFSAWMVAVRALQEPKLADFAPQLQAILGPARRLSGNYAIRIDVTRVASFYLHKYAGIEPLPTDPPPR